MRNRSSSRTSCQVGSFPEALGANRRPKSDGANAFPATHDKSAAHLLLHAASTLAFNNSGGPCALCCANARNWLFWQDHRPPTSPARTTSLACTPLHLPVLGMSVLSATTSAATGLVADPALAIPSPCNALTSITWDNPSVTNPNHGPSRWSRPLLRPLDRCVPQQSPPEHLRQHTQTNDGQSSLGDATSANAFVNT